MDSTNAGLLRVVLKEKKTILTTGLQSGIFRIHIQHSISAKERKQQNISKLKYQCIGAPYS